jgi:anti-sigma regulatory factor (Ser/Thr protein kinase)
MVVTSSAGLRGIYFQKSWQGLPSILGLAIEEFKPRRPQRTPRLNSANRETPMILHQKRWESRPLDKVAQAKATYWVRFHVMAEFLPAFQKLDRWMRELRFPRVDRFAAGMVLQEALTNAVRHGHGGNRLKPIRLTLMANPNEVAIEVEDSGPGFDPDRVLGAFAPTDRQRGRGLFLMRAYASWISISGRGNCVTFGRRRTVRPKTIVVAPTESAAD